MDDEAGREWLKGYQAARSRCLTRGVETARLHAPRRVNPAYEAGYDWGLWDHEDANGLPHPRDVGA